MALLRAVGSATAMAILTAQRIAQSAAAAKFATGNIPDAWVEISIEYEENQMILPTNPDQINIVRGTRNFTIDVLELGEIILPNSADLLRVSFTSQFWTERAPMIAGDYMSWINEWRWNKKPGRLVIVNNNEESTYHGLNIFVLCDTFETNEGRAGTEDDVYYSFALTQWRD